LIVLWIILAIFAGGITVGSTMSIPASRPAVAKPAPPRRPLPPPATPPIAKRGGGAARRAG